MLRACHFEDPRVHIQDFRPARSAAAPALLLSLAVVLAGCSLPGKGKVTNASWADDAVRGQTFKRVLVVGVSADLDARCNFERYLATRIRSESTVAMTSCASVTKRDPLTRESIEEAVRAKQADAVIATVLVSKDWHLQKGGDRDTRGGGMYKAVDSGWGDFYGYYGTYGVPVIYAEFQTAPSVTTLKTDAEVRTMVYSTRDAKLVFTLDTVIKNAEGRSQGLDAATTPIAERLRRENLIR
jgi:hypothetical protein